jgi:hypothetical protein
MAKDLEYAQDSNPAPRLLDGRHGHETCIG